MHFYNPSPLSLGYIPRASYRPALVYTYLGDESSSALTSEGLGYPAFSHTSTPRLGAETRYRRAVHGLQTAEEELEAHLTLKRARQAVFLREQAARCERVLAIQAEVDRIERARALQAQLAEEYEWYQRAPQAQVALDQGPLLLHAFADTNPRDLFASGLFARERPTDSGPSRHPMLHDSEVPTLEGLLKLFTGIRPQPHSSLQQSSSAAPSQHHPAEPQPSEKQDAATDAFNAVLEFIHGLAAHACDSADGTTPEAAPVDEKGKAKAEPAAGHAAGPTLLQTLLGAHTQGPSDQESKDIELAIKLSLEDRDAADAKKASAAKASRSSLGASSSRVKLDGAVPSSQTPSSASDTTSAASQPIPGPVLQPVSPLTAIRAVRNQLSTLESTFKFPVDLDFDQSVLGISPNNAPLRAHENMLNGLLEHLDAIESDGDEEVRNTRREVVREVEKALEGLERRVSEKAFELQVIKDAEAKVHDAEEALAAQDAVPADAASAAKGAKPTGPEPSATVFPSDGDADVDLAISEEYLPSPTAVESPKPAVAQTADKDVSSLDADETAPVLEDSSDYAPTIAAPPVSASLASP
ncbi:hypothetical protein EDB85DRAFT_938726 [Lactarius pseudohatsudake]|nr:hypothetical protein EDB85DRAFT_938726 [Lactarius pseudohatsudake]